MHELLGNMIAKQVQVGDLHIHSPLYRTVKSTGRVPRKLIVSVYNTLKMRQRYFSPCVLLLLEYTIIYFEEYLHIRKPQK